MSLEKGHLYCTLRLPEFYFYIIKLINTANHMYQVLALGFMRLHVDYMQNKGRVELSWHSWRLTPLNA